ncbi:MAG: hypothetical protein ABJN69_11325 [Hellea sp.]
MSGLGEDYGLPHKASARDALDEINTLNPSDAGTPGKLLELKQRFALGWSALSLGPSPDFKSLGALQSQFAASSIDMALRAAWHIEGKSLKLKPQPDNIPGLFILGLGKLGGLDLNFSSDVDLIAYYDPETLPVSKNMGQSYVINKVLKTMGQILKPRNGVDFIWRVDWRLRPESSASQLSMSINMAQDFYFFRALPWHRLALMKARVIAGDIETGQAFLQNVTPFIWRQNLDFRALDELAHLKSRINLEHPALRQQRAAPQPITPGAAGFNVKLGSGGIREIEFIANAQQLVWGGKQYELRTPNTLEALEELAASGHMPKDLSQRLSQSYITLRQLENAIQMLGNEQTHIVPASEHSQQSLLTLLGETNWESFCEPIESIRRFVNAEFGKIFDVEEASSSTSDSFEANLDALEPAAKDIAQNWLNGFFPRSNNTEQFQSLGQGLLEGIFSSSVSSNGAIIRVNQFFKALSRSEQYLHLLSRNQKLLDALIPPLLYSPHMTVLLEQSPHIIDVFLSPQDAMDTGFVFQSHDYETRLERLRRFVNENLFMHYHAFMHEGGTASILQEKLTCLADMTIEAALKIVADDLSLETLPVTVLGLGKMGTSRMAPLSDIDLVFIFDDDADTDMTHKAVRRLRTALTAKLSEGIAYELDMRLRPSGRSGPAAVKLSSFRGHHETRAHNWEHIALAHSRIVAGDKQLGAKTIAVRDEVLATPRDKAQFLSDAKAMWTLIERQRVDDTPPTHFNSKLRPGGLMQAEYTENCYRLLGRNADNLKDSIVFWSNLQLWERLLGLTGQPLTDTPSFYTPQLLAQFGAKSLKDITALQAQHAKAVLKAYDTLLRNITLPPHYESARILWTDR